MIDTVVFGGTFDPPHKGHKNLLMSVMEKGYKKAIVIPTGTPPHKSGKTAKSSFENRFELCKKMFGDMDGVTVSDIEGKREGKSYTVDTLDALRKQYPDCRLHLLMGSDMLLYIEKWYRFEDILRETPIISAARTKDDVLKIKSFKKYLEQNYDCNIIIYDMDIVDISSTVLRSPLVCQIDEHNKKNLKKERYDHVQSVADYAVYLAGFHNVDPYSAYIAALCHDCTKYLDTEAGQLDYFEKYNIDVTDEEKRCPKIHHQITGAHFAKNVFKIEDEDILNAIRYHTTGRKNMSKLEMLVCLADSIEPSRDYEGVEKMREVAKISLEKSLYLCFDRLLKYIKQRGLEIHPQTSEARDWLKGIINE